MCKKKKKVNMSSGKLSTCAPIKISINNEYLWWFKFSFSFEDIPTSPTFSYSIQIMKYQKK